MQKISQLDEQQSTILLPCQKLSEQLAKSLQLHNQNCLLFLSQSLEQCSALAIRLYRDMAANPNQTILLVDFNIAELDEISFELVRLQIQNVVETVEITTTVVKLQMLIEKRRQLYLTYGVYSVSLLVFMMDVLRGQLTINPKYLSKVYVKMQDKVDEYRHHLAWVTLMIKRSINRHQSAGKQDHNGDNSMSHCPMYFICKHPEYYSDDNQLSRVCRTLFCKKVLIWPFGRSEIHRAIKALKDARQIRQIEHRIVPLRNEATISDIVHKLLNFLRKSYQTKYNKSLSNEQILYSPMRDSLTRSLLHNRQINQMYEVRWLLMLLHNSRKLKCLQVLAEYTNTKDADVWKSNNSLAMELVGKLEKEIKETILPCRRVEQGRKVDLKGLVKESMMLVDGRKETESAEEGRYECWCELQYELVLLWGRSEKINQLLRIVETELMRIKDHHSGRKEEEKGADKAKKIVLRDDMRLVQDGVNMVTVLVYLQTHNLRKQVQKELRQFLSKTEYLQFLRDIQVYLLTTHSQRLTRLKRVYGQLKVQIISSQQSCQTQSKRRKHKGWQQIKQQNMVVLQALLLQQITSLLNIIKRYKQTYQFLSPQQPQCSPNHQSQQQSAITKLQNQLINSHYHMLDPTRVTICLNNVSIDDLILYDTATSRRCRFVLIDGSKQCPLLSYLQAVRTVNPEIVVFYVPNTSLLRASYLSLCENSQYLCHLEAIHVIMVDETEQVGKVKYQVEKEDEAFWRVAKARKQLPIFFESPECRIDTLEGNLGLRMIDRQYHEKVQSVLNRTESAPNTVQQSQSIALLTTDLQLLSPIRKVIIVDTRQFKSKLPSYLYHYGYQVVPLFLETADYILSNHIAIEKKSVHTKDLHQSLRSNRLEKQLARMCLHFKKVCLLIECEEIGDCRKDNFLEFAGEGGRHQLRRKLMQLVKKYPNIRMVWSTSLIRTCEIFKMLKKDAGEPEVAKFRPSKEKEEGMQEQMEMNVTEKIVDNPLG